MSMKSQIALLTTMVISVFAGVLYQQHKVALPGNIVTLAQFSSKMPPPQKVIVFEKDGSSFVEVIGQLPGFPKVPSGPPAYIFDSSGQIAYWTGDTGDSAGYWEKWHDRANTREVSLCEALQWVAESK
jgi:hypothetical protein